MSTASSGRVASPVLHDPRRHHPSMAGARAVPLAAQREPVPWLLVVLWAFAALALGFAMYFAVATGFGDVPSY